MIARFAVTPRLPWRDSAGPGLLLEVLALAMIRDNPTPAFAMLPYRAQAIADWQAAG